MFIFNYILIPYIFGLIVNKSRLIAGLIFTIMYAVIDSYGLLYSASSIINLNNSMYETKQVA